jgi:8-oxo-dGTP diphosphatase
MSLRLRLRRLGYRGAYTVLRLYWFLVRPEVTGVKGVLSDGQRVLLVRHTYGCRRWDFPGGTMKRGEAPAAAIVREMHEELGITPEWQPLGEVRGQMFRRHDTLLCFRADVPAPSLILDHGEIAAVRWFTRDQLPPDTGQYVRPILGLLA